MDKYPNISPYNYCLWNPVILVDPDGEWPWDPKHIKQARRFAHDNDGTLKIWKERNGIKMASVAYTDRTLGDEGVVTIIVFRPEGYNPQGQIKQASGLTNIEMWVDSPSDNLGEFSAKSAARFFYSVPNDLSMSIAGKTMAGTEVTSTEREEAFVETVAAVLSPFIKATRVVTSTNATKGLKGYNEFVKKNPGIIKRLAHHGAGKAFKRNQILQEGIADYKKANESIQVTKEVANGFDK